ncbi:MAG: Fur family transcriptional regulator [Pseudobdellovibrionaceae bacterium]
MQKGEKAGCLTTAEIEKKLIEAGIQPTLQRLEIAKYVLCQAEHPTAEDVKAWADENLAKISLATIYNTLGTLVNAGLLREFRFSHTDKVVYDNRLEDHFHFVDEDTGALHDISLEEVELSPRLKKKFLIQGIDLVFRGSVKT